MKLHEEANEHKLCFTHSFVVNEGDCSGVRIGDVSDGATVKLLDLLNNLLVIKDNNKKQTNSKCKIK